MNCLLLAAFLGLAVLASAQHAQRRTCPAQGDFSSANANNVRLQLLVDDAFTSDPINGDNTAGFVHYLGFTPTDTRNMFFKGLAYIKWRFGIDGTSCHWDPVSMSCFLTLDPHLNATAGWKVAGTSDPVVVAITPVSYSAGNTYRVVTSNTPHILVVPEADIYPTVRLAQWIMTFLAPVNITGDAGREANPATGYYTINLDPGLTVGDGVAWGRYVICSLGRNYSFDMRSWVVSRRWPAYNAQNYYYTEKFQLGSLQPTVIPSGHATLEIVYPGGPLVQNGVTTYPWYVGAQWNLGTLVSHPSYNQWNVGCGTACDTTTIPAGGSH